MTNKFIQIVKCENCNIHFRLYYGNCSNCPYKIDFSVFSKLQVSEMRNK